MDSMPSETMCHGASSHMVQLAEVYGIPQEALQKNLRDVSEYLQACVALLSREVSSAPEAEAVLGVAT